MKRLIFVALLLLLTSFAFSTTYVIDSYNFILQENTDASVIYSKLKLQDHLCFESYEALKRFVTSKEQEIANWNIFNTTESYVIESPQNKENSNAEEMHYTAVFEINDKSPIFVFPVPKYDSNTGLSLGVGISSENFAGKLAHFFSQLIVEQKDKTFENANYSLEFFINNFPIFNFQMDAFCTFLYNGQTKGVSLDLGSTFFDIKLGETVTFKINPKIKFTPTADKLFAVNEYSYTATFENLLTSLGGFTFTQGLSYTPKTNTFKATHSLTYYGIKIKGDPLKPSLSFQNNEITAAVSWEHSELNKDIHGNQDFRKGTSLSLAFFRTQPISNLLTATSQYATFTFKWFPYANNWLNLSTRLTAILSQNPTNHLSDDNPNNQSSLISSYLRGLNTNGYNSQQLYNAIVIVNLDLKTKCFDLGSWARTYATPFIDIALLVNEEQSSTLLYTFGIEAIGVLCNHASYPLRVSLGFNSNLDSEVFVGTYYYY